MKTFVIVAAIAENNVIGRDNQLIWHLKNDLRYFRTLTIGKPVIMGRKTYQSIGKPLPGRDNIVLSRDASFHAEGVCTVSSWEQACEQAECLAQKSGTDHIMVIGGAEIYRLALPQAKKLCLTRVHTNPEGDAFFPDVDFSNYKLTFQEHHKADENNDYDFTFMDYAKSC